MLRTHTCHALNSQHLHQNVILCGWVQNIRDKGTILWIDLRDHYGITQLVAEKDKNSVNVIQAIKTLSRETVIQVKGQVIERASKNKNIPTGDIEVSIESINILNHATLLPFPIHDKQAVSESLRMQYRYLDLRRKTLQDYLRLKHQVIQSVHQFLDQHQFLHLETPHLIKSTPEGARDFLVPARQLEEHFYALPQSPQMLKQLLMVAGFDRYYQIAKCFRDEDLRADRQPEFTQIDCEMAFIEQEDILVLFEQLIKTIFQQTKNITLPKFKRMPYTQAIQQYGTDKPDLRWGMPFFDLKQAIPPNDFPLWKNQTHIKGIIVDDLDGMYTRKKIDQLKGALQKFHPVVGSRLVYIKYKKDNTIVSSINRFFTSAQLQAFLQTIQAKPGHLVCILAGDDQPTQDALAMLRQIVIQNKIDAQSLPLQDFIPVWITDFPLLHWDGDVQKYTAMHHPFTAPQLPEEGWGQLDLYPEKVKAQAYDLVINGVEIGGGSIRIHQKQLQEKILQLLGFTPKTMQQQFGFFLNALQYGAPPHGGIAIGLDRLCATMQGTHTIRDFIPFPKNHQGRDVMMEAPSRLDLV